MCFAHEACLLKLSRSSSNSDSIDASLTQCRHAHPRASCTTSSEQVTLSCLAATWQDYDGCQHGLIISALTQEKIRPLSLLPSGCCIQVASWVMSHSMPTWQSMASNTQWSRSLHRIVSETVKIGSIVGGSGLILQRIESQLPIPKIC